MRPGGRIEVETIKGRSNGPRRVWVEIPSADAVETAWAFTDQQSYFPGEDVNLYVSSTTADVKVRITRDPSAGNWRHEQTVTAEFQPVSDKTYETGCDWKATMSLKIPSEADTGAYLVEMVATSTGTVLGHHLFIVRPTKQKRKPLVLVLATSTWTAYNDFGGANHYFGLNSGASRGRSPILSPQRPWARGQVWLPEGAPRVVSRSRPTHPQPSQHEETAWAYLNNYSKYYASAGWASYERHFVKWMENQGYEIDLLTQRDLHFEPQVLDSYDCVFFVGHDEYWTAEMRDHVDEYVDSGGHVARFAGNFMWQIRIDPQNEQQITYKYDALTDDPIVESGDLSKLTGAWEDPRVGRPGAETFGVNALRGMYAGVGSMAPRAARGYTVFREDHWAFEETGLGYADMFGDEASIFGFEMDGVEYEIRDGLPYPTGSDGAPEGMEILAMNFSTAMEHGLERHQHSFMLGDGDARYRAYILDNDTSPENIKRHSRLAGMVVSFQRGKGEVFSAATCEWINGLLEHDFYVETITHNVIQRFSKSRFAR
jgi:hypothetical protein